MRRITSILVLVLAFPLFARDLGSRPIVLVHGFGPDLYTQLFKYRRFLTQDGVKSSDILMVSYDSSAAPADIVSKVSEQLETFLAQYPAGQKFDVVGHSMGGFVGLYAPLNSRFADQVAKFTSLTGWAHGQAAVPFLCGFSFAHGCGLTLPQMVPTDSPLITKFYTDNAARVARIQKCALYSPDDKMTANPDDSGAFPDGVRAEVRNVRHLDFVNDEDLYHIMTNACYGEPAPTEGYRHEWRIVQ